MQISTRGDSIKTDAESRQLVIDSLNEAAHSWLKQAKSETNDAKSNELLNRAGLAKSFAMALVPKAEAD